MRDPNNIWEDRFNKADLSEEEWLAPSADVFKNIAAELDPKSKSRKYTVLIFLIFCFCITAYLLLLPVKKPETLFSTKESKLTSLSEKSNAVNFADTKQSIAEDLNVNTNFSTGDVENISVLGDSEQESSSVLPKASASYLSNKNSLNRNKLSYTNVTANVNAKTLEEDVLSQYQSQSQFQIPNADEVNFSNRTIDNPIDVNTEKVNSTQETINKSLSHSFGVLPLSALPVLNHRLVAVPKTVKVKSPSYSINGFNKDPIQKHRFISVAFQTEDWNFKLNNNYSTALNPADFTHSHGSAYGMSVKYGMEISKDFFIVGGLGLSRVSFESGHNSVLSYNLNNETAIDHSNQFDLTMASPIGFIESDIVVQRSSNTQGLLSDIVVDLNNNHTLYNIEFSAGMDYRFFEKNRLSLSVGFYAGLNYFSSVSNTLSHFNVDDNSFSSGASAVTKDQQNLNEVTPFVAGQLSIDYTISKSWSLGANLQFKTNLSPIYQENDFSTQLDRWGSGLVLKRAF